MRSLPEAATLLSIWIVLSSLTPIASASQAGDGLESPAESASSTETATEGSDRGGPEGSLRTYENSKFGYRVSYPPNWIPSVIDYANAFEIRNYDRKNPEAVADRNRASIVIVDVENDNAAATARFMESLLAKDGPRDLEVRETNLDGNRAVIVRGRVPADAISRGAKVGQPESDRPPSYYSFSTYVANGKHVLSIEVRAQVGADAGVLEQAEQISSSVVFLNRPNVGGD